MPSDNEAVRKAVDAVVRDQVPVCLRLCEPICAQSDYQVTLAWFGVPAATLTVKGVTRFAECKT
jgi:hypothetical protein